MNTTTPNDGGPAFPLATSSGSNTSVNGMTLRDWFAGQAMRGLLGTDPTKSNFWDYPKGAKVEDWLSRNAYQIADAMIAARNTNTAAQ
jgi:hypothetical protein